MNDFDFFFDMLLESIKAVDGQYLNTLYDSVLMIENSHTNNSQKHFLIKSAERTICNELYYQLRSRIDTHREVFPDYLQNTILQAEVQKHQIMEILDQMELVPLSRNFIPDFIMHTPGNAELHAFVIEVKSNINLTSRQIQYDLNKIAEFINRYRYQRGVFLAFNNSLDDLSELMQRCNFTKEALHESPNISVITRESNSYECQFDTLNNILNV